MPKISVIVPVYKVEEYLKRCVDSILSQSFEDFELILVDDGSPDDCGNICDNYANTDVRVRVIHQDNQGLSAARNAGLDLVFKENTTEWITFIDSDDWVHPEYLERLCNAAVDNGVDVSVCEYCRTDKFVSCDFLMSDALIYSSEEYYVKDSVNSSTAWGKLYRKELFTDIRYPVGKIHEDEYTTYKLMFRAEKIAVIHTPLYFYYSNTNGITGETWSVKRLQALDAFTERLKYLKGTKFKKAYVLTISIYQYHIQRLFGVVEQSDSLENKKEVINNLRKRLRRVLRLKKKNGLMVEGAEKNIYLYELAYPRTMKLYWYGVAVLKKLGL